MSNLTNFNDNKVLEIFNLIENFYYDHKDYGYGEVDFDDVKSFIFDSIHCNNNYDEEHLDILDAVTFEDVFPTNYTLD